MNVEPTSHDMQPTIDAIQNILNTLQGLNDAHEALMVLSSCTAFLLCNAISSAKDADESYKIFCNVTGQAIDAAESMGATIWTRGTVH